MNQDQEVIKFVADFTGINQDKIGLDSTLLGELGVDGADGWELVEAFGKKFEVDTTNFRAERHFGAEGLSLLAPFLLLWCLLGPVTKKATAEEGSGLTPIRISDMIAMAEKKKWNL